MKVIKRDYLYQLISLPRAFPVNCYFVEEDDEITLIDAALPFSIKGILQTANKIGKPITRIVLTHAHGDHVGALDQVKEAYPQASVIISGRDAKLLSGDVSLEQGEPNTPIKGSVPKSLKTRPDILIQDGDRIGSLQAIFTPGHTPGHMAFLDVRNGACIAGDAMQTRGGIAVAGKVKPLFPFPALGTWSKVQSLESARRLREFSPTLLAVGHGPMLTNPTIQMDKAIREAEQSIKAGAKR